MSDETPQIDLEKGVITLKKGDETRSFSTKSADDLNSLVKLGQRGWYFDDEASRELGDLRKVIKNWDTAIEAAKTDDEAMASLVNKLELAVGRSLTRAEQRELDKGNKPQILLDDEENSKLLDTIGALEKEIKALKQSQDAFKKSSEEEKMERIKAEISAEADRLEKVYDGKDGSPKFERQKVFNFAADKNIEDLELAFRLLNFDKLTEHAKKQALSEFQKTSTKRKSSFVETGDQPAPLQTERARSHKTYHKLGAEALKAAKNEGLSLFTTEN